MGERIGRPQGGLRSEAGRAAYWRMNYESTVGALADLIAEAEWVVVDGEDVAMPRVDWHAAVHTLLPPEAARRIAQALLEAAQEIQHGA